MIGGLTLATFATLLVVPALYGLALPWRRGGARAPAGAALSPAE
jgi:Cu/Ag efflux pump CusA